MSLLLRGVEPEDLIMRFDDLISEFIRGEGTDDAEMIRRFGESRAAWQASDSDAWFDAQGYPHTLAPVNGVVDRAIIATTKQNEFACKLVTRAGLKVLLPRVYGLERLGPQKKRNVLEELLRRNPTAQVHFFKTAYRYRSCRQIYPVYTCTWWTGATTCSRSAPPQTPVPIWIC